MTKLTQERLTQIHTNIICCYYDLPKEKYLFPIDKEGGVIEVFKKVVLQLREEGITVYGKKNVGDLIRYLDIFYLALDTDDPIGFIYTCFNMLLRSSPFSFLLEYCGNINLSRLNYSRHFFNHVPLPKKLKSTRISYEDYKKISLDAFNMNFNTLLKLVKEDYAANKSEENQKNIDSLNIVYAKVLNSSCYTDNYEGMEDDYIMIDKWLKE